MSTTIPSRLDGSTDPSAAGAERSEPVGRAKRGGGGGRRGGRPELADELKALLPDELLDELLAGARTEGEIAGPGGDVEIGSTGHGSREQEDGERPHMLRLARQGTFERRFELLLRESRTDEKLLPSARAQRDRLPAVGGRHGHPDLHRAAGVAHLPDHARNNGTNLPRMVGQELFEQVTHAVDDAVLDFQFVLRGA